jgi:hypothetical protein
MLAFTALIRKYHILAKTINKMFIGQQLGAALQ